jgi:hypothetical protein
MMTTPAQPPIDTAEQFAPGDIYEDCAYHPVFCVSASEEDDEIWGISLIDGSYPRNCSLAHCGVRKLTVGEALALKQRHILLNGQDGWWETEQSE